jgi:hypothetical protein
VSLSVSWRRLVSSANDSNGLVAILRCDSTFSTAVSRAAVASLELTSSSVSFGMLNLMLQAEGANDELCYRKALQGR